MDWQQQQYGWSLPASALSDVSSALTRTLPATCVVDILMASLAQKVISFSTAQLSSSQLSSARTSKEVKRWWLLKWEVITRFFHGSLRQLRLNIQRLSRFVPAYSGEEEEEVPIVFRRLIASAFIRFVSLVIALKRLIIGNVLVR